MNLKEFLALRVIQAFAIGIALGVGAGWFVFRSLNPAAEHPYALSSNGSLRINRKTGEVWLVTGTGFEQIKDSR